MNELGWLQIGFWVGIGLFGALGVLLGSATMIIFAAGLVWGLVLRLASRRRRG